jgi:hypothetical protein
MLPRPDPVDPLAVKKQSLLRVFYAAALGCAAAFVLAQYSHNFQREALLTLSLLGSSFVVWTLLRFLRAIDEFERRYIYEALTFAFIGMLILLIGEAFLESFGFSRVPGYGNVVLAVVLWSAGLIISSWRRHWRYE